MPDTMTAREIIESCLNSFGGPKLAERPLAVCAPAVTAAILRALDAAGKKIVPREATAGMTDSGCTTLEEGRDAYHQEMMAQEIYRAMVAAAEGV